MEFLKFCERYFGESLLFAFRIQKLKYKQQWLYLQKGNSRRAPAHTRKHQLATSTSSQQHICTHVIRTHNKRAVSTEHCAVVWTVHKCVCFRKCLVVLVSTYSTNKNIMLSIFRTALASLQSAAETGIRLLSLKSVQIQQVLIIETEVTKECALQNKTKDIAVLLEVLILRYLFFSFMLEHFHNIGDRRTTKRNQITFNSVKTALCCHLTTVKSEQLC